MAKASTLPQRTLPHRTHNPYSGNKHRRPQKRSLCCSHGELCLPWHIHLSTGQNSPRGVQSDQNYSHHLLAANLGKALNKSKATQSIQQCAGTDPKGLQCCGGGGTAQSDSTAWHQNLGPQGLRAEYPVWPSLNSTTRSWFFPTVHDLPHLHLQRKTRTQRGEPTYWWARERSGLSQGSGPKGLSTVTQLSQQAEH